MVRKGRNSRIWDCTPVHQSEPRVKAQPASYRIHGVEGLRGARETVARTPWLPPDTIHQVRSSLVWLPSSGSPGRLRPGPRETEPHCPPSSQVPMGTCPVWGLQGRRAEGPPLATKHDSVRQTLLPAILTLPTTVSRVSSIRQNPGLTSKVPGSVFSSSKHKTCRNPRGNVALTQEREYPSFLEDRVEHKPLHKLSHHQDLNAS